MEGTVSRKTEETEENVMKSVRPTHANLLQLQKKELFSFETPWYTN